MRPPVQSDICFKSLARSQAPVIFLSLLLNNVYYCFRVKQRSFQLFSDYLRIGRALIFLDLLSFPSQTPLQSPQPAFLKLTFLYFKGIRNLNALACLPKNAYLCIGNGRKGSISRMSDECLMKQETVFSFYVVYQAVMRKFTLAGKSGARASGKNNTFHRQSFYVNN